MKSILVIGFSLIKQYDSPKYSDILEEFDNVLYLHPSKYLWKHSFFNFNILYKRIVVAFRRLNNNENWVSYSRLKRYKHFQKLENTSPKSFISYSKVINSFKLSKRFVSLIKKDSFEFRINGVECSAYLLDSLQRFSYTFNICKPDSKISFFGVWIYIYKIISYLNWLENFVDNQKIHSLIINHNVYIESGFISAYLMEKFGSKIIFLSQKSKDPVWLNSRHKWFKKILDKRLAESISQNVNQNNLKNDIWNLDYALSDIDDCSKKEIDCNKIVVIMHCFSDANSMHPVNDVIFTSYFQWIRKTLSIAKKNKNINYIFRAHPGSFTSYKWDKKILDFLFSHITEKNITLETPDNYTNHFNSDKVPLFVTAKGNFTQEIAIAGLRCITLDESSAPNKCCKIVRELTEYEKWLSGKGENSLLYLNKQERFIARRNREIYATINGLDEQK